MQALFCKSYIWDQCCGCGQFRANCTLLSVDLSSSLMAQGSGHWLFTGDQEEALFFNAIKTPGLLVDSYEERLPAQV